jgi:hypothetical protein
MSEVIRRLKKDNVERPYFVIRGVYIHMRSGLAEEWAKANPLLKNREPALELDTRRVKIGDGLTLYKKLPYVYSLDQFIWGASK